MNINQEQLIIFKTVIESGSFSAAARQLGKVPSAVSMSIANLEVDLNSNPLHPCWPWACNDPTSADLVWKTKNSWKRANSLLNSSGGSGAGYGYWFPISQIWTGELWANSAKPANCGGKSRPQHQAGIVIFKKILAYRQSFICLCQIQQGLGWGVLPLEMLNQNPHIQQQLKILNFRFHSKIWIFCWSGLESWKPAGCGCSFLINHIRNSKKKT